MLKRDWAMCWKYAKHCKINGQFGGGGSIWPLNGMRTFTLIMDKIFTWASKIMRQMATGKVIWICQLSCANCIPFSYIKSYHQWAQRVSIQTRHIYITYTFSICKMHYIVYECGPQKFSRAHINYLNDKGCNHANFHVGYFNLFS